MSRLAARLLAPRLLARPLPRPLPRPPVRHLNGPGGPVVLGSNPCNWAIIENR